MTVIPTILIVEDDDGHAFLIEENLRRGGVTAPIIRFCDGQEILDFLFHRTAQPCFEPGGAYLVSLDIRMPRADGIETLRQIKADAGLRSMPVIMLTTTDDSREVQRCHELGCNGYVQKPVSFDRFAMTINKLAHFFSVMELPLLPAAQGSALKADAGFVVRAGFQETPQRGAADCSPPQESPEITSARTDIKDATPSR